MVFFVLAFAFAAAPAARAASSCDINARLDCLVVSSNVTRFGFPAFLENYQNPTIYLRKTVQSGATVNNSCYVCHERGTKSISDTFAYPPGGTSPVLTNWSGFLSHYSEQWSNGNQITINCSSTRTGPHTWSDPTCLFNVASPSDVLVSNLTANSSTYILTNYSRSVVPNTNGGGGGVYEISESSRNQIDLANPFSLSDFVAASLSGLQAAPWQNWTNAAHTGCAERGGQNIVTILNSDTASFNANLSKLKYRIAVQGPKDQKQTIVWYERFIPNGSGVVSNATFIEEVMFTGDEQFLITAGGEQGKEVSPPGAAGRICVELERNFSCDGRNCEPGRGDVSNGSIDAKISLGKNLFGQTAGFLYVREELPTNTLGSPQSLHYFVNNGVQVLQSTGVLRQIKAPQALADVMPIASGYEVRLYSNPGTTNGSGFYQPVGPPFITWRFESSNSTQLRITQTGDGGPITNDFTWAAADNGWTLTTAGLRKQTKSVVVSGGFRYETNTVKEMNGAIVYRDSRKWWVSGGSLGDLLFEETMDPSVGNLKTTWTYYTNAASDGASFGKLKEVVRPGTGWERDQYDGFGRLTNTVTQFLNAALGSSENSNRVTRYSYAPVDPLDSGTTQTNTARTIIKTLLGSNNEMERTYRIFRTNETLEIQCQTPGASPTAADNLITRTRFYTEAGFSGTIEANTSPDGTMQITRNPTASPGTGRTVTSSVGQPNAAGTSIIDGTRTLTVYDGAGRVQSTETLDILTATTLGRETYGYADAYGSQPASVTYLDGTTTATAYDCCSVSTAIDRDGTATSFTYDALRRLTSTTRAGITVSNFYDAAGNITNTLRRGTDGSAITLSRATFDKAGRQLTATDATLTNTTTTAVEGGAGSQAYQITTFPNGAQRVEISAADGLLLSSVGNATHPVRFEYGVESESGLPRFYTREIKLNTNGTDTAEWTKTYSDLLGRPYKSVYPDGAVSQTFFNNQGQRWKEVDPDSVTNLFGYNAKGEAETQAIDLDADGQINFAGTDRITRTVTDVNNGRRRTRTFAWPTLNSAISNLLSEITASADGLDTWQTVLTLPPAHTRTEYLGLGARRVTQTAPDGTQTIQLFKSGQLRSSSTRNPELGTLNSLTYGYDAHGRPTTLTDARTGTTTSGFDVVDQVISAISPAPTPGTAPQTNSFFYNRAGQVVKTVLPDAASVTNAYLVTGELQSTAGARIYAAQYEYEAQGRLKKLTTATGATTWNYDAQRGWLANKRYPDNKGTDYTYTRAGRLRTRLWARGVTATYTNNAAGDLAAIIYADGTPTTTFAYDRRGRATTITQGTNVTTLTFNDAGQLTSETRDGLTVTNNYDSLLRLTVQRFNGSTLVTNSFAYDPSSRLAFITNGAISAGYNYVANSPLIHDIVFRQNNSARMATSKNYDSLNRLTRIGSQTSTGGVFSFDYLYNAANQRIAVTNTDNSRWTFGYDFHGQVISGKRQWSDGLFVDGQQFEYTFDSIGNRLWTKAGGYPSGQTNLLRQNFYTPNSLNQYTQRTFTNEQGFTDIMGEAPAATTVTVNGQTAIRHGEYYRAVAAPSPYPNNTTGALWLAESVQAGAESKSGGLFIPRNPEVFAYDADGNLTTNGQFTLTWDAENRLTGCRPLPGTPTNAWVLITNVFDYAGRRVSKVVSNWTGLAWAKTSEQRFIYNGWNLLTILDATNNPVFSFTWGLDLSGSRQGAGGVGGLLSMTVHTGVLSGIYLYVHDGNGNVMALINAATDELAARYEYGPFGELLRATGPLAFVNPFRFSTKFQDNETGWLSYGYRYYDPATGRWLNRDPLEEATGLNLYGFVLNSPSNIADTDGRQLWFFGMPKVAQPLTPLESVLRVGGEVGRTGFEDFRVPPEYYGNPPSQPGLQPAGPGLFPPVVLNPPVPSTDPSSNPIPVPNPSPSPFPGNNAPPVTVEETCGEWLCRLGTSWESKERLAEQAAQAEARPAFGHGVSVLLFTKPPPNASCAPRKFVEAAFEVRKTGERKNHYTLILPKPVTDAIASKFNRTFRRIPPPPPPPPPRDPRFATIQSNAIPTC